MLKKNIFGWAILSLSLVLSTITANANNKTCLGPSKTGGFTTHASVCDFTFASIPTFSCGPSTETMPFVIQNNTPAPIKINYITFQINDGQPAGDVSVTGGTCTVGGFVPAHGTCTVNVTINPIGPYSRILKIGVDGRQIELDSPIVTPTAGCNVPSTPSPNFITTSCTLASTSTFATLANTFISNTGLTVLNGDLGISPGSSVTGFPPGIINGNEFINDSIAATAQSDLFTLGNCLAVQVCTNNIGTADQAGQTLTATDISGVNVFCSPSTILNTGVLTLDGNGDPDSVFIFQAQNGLTLSNGASILLINGAQAKNIFWEIDGPVSLGSASSFNGSVVGFTDISMGFGATMTGRALSKTGSVTFDTNTINLP